MNNPKVSVVMPCYNAAQWLPTAIDSILAQTLVDMELICVDDGSADPTPEILAQYTRRDARVRCIRITHSGVIQAMNTGLEASRCNLVARMDADDVALPQRLALQSELLEARPDIGVVGSRVRFGGSRKNSRGYALHVDWTNSLLGSEAIRLNRFVELPLPNPSIMFRKDLIHRFGKYRDGDFPEDYEIILRWLDQGVAMTKVDRDLLVWNDPSGRLSRTHSRYDVNAFFAVKARYLARWLNRHNPHHPAVVVIGAGRTARKRAALLERHGVDITSYVDIDPNKVGHRVHGRPVIHRNDLPPPGSCFCLSYVGNRGARQDIEAFLSEKGYRPGREYLLAS